MMGRVELFMDILTLSVMNVNDAPEVVFWVYGCIVSA